jgi:hypothetical protein
VLVSFGDPGSYQPDVIVAVMGGTVPIDRPTMGTGRSREKTVTVNVVISVYVPGGDAAAPAAWITAQSMADQLEAYFRTSPNEQLSGACRDAWVSSTTPTFAKVVDPTSNNVTGATADVAVAITAHVRI